MAIEVTSAESLHQKIAKLFIKAFKWAANKLIPDKAREWGVPVPFPQVTSDPEKQTQAAQV